MNCIFSFVPENARISLYIFIYIYIYIYKRKMEINLRLSKYKRYEKTKYSEDV